MNIAYRFAPSNSAWRSPTVSARLSHKTPLRRFLVFHVQSLSADKNRSKVGEITNRTTKVFAVERVASACCPSVQSVLLGGLLQSDIQ